MNIMIDLETMGHGPRAAIVAIGAVGFDLESGIQSPRFYERVELASSMEAGLETSASTIKWWMSQSPEARTEIMGRAVPLVVALRQFSQWMESYDPRRVLIWGHGAGFDNVILRSAFDACGYPCPWPWWNDRCYRTLAALYPAIEADPPEIKHHALHDAVAQAKHAIAILRCVQGITT